MDSSEEGGFGGCFWIMLLLGLVGVFGFMGTLGYALGG